MIALGTEPRVAVLERLVHPGLLGLRFWDTSARRPVQDGLTVKARDVHGRVAEAIVNRTGVWSFPTLPGLSSADLERARAERRQPVRRSFVVSVSDERGRFLPAELGLSAPAEEGLFEWDRGSSPPSFGLVPLFSSPTRPAPGGHLMVRADLWDLDEARPAAWALLQLTVTGAAGEDVFMGMADARGCVAVVLPVPFVPIDGTRAPLARRTWSARVRVSYAPALTSATGPSRTERESLPQLDRILAQLERAPATAFTTLSPVGELDTVTLRLAEPLVLQTAHSGADEPLQSLLLVRPAP